jgi:hypothetical protein
MEGRLNANKTTSGVTIDLFTENLFVNRTMKEHHTTGSVSNSIISFRRGLPAGYLHGALIDLDGGTTITM